MGQRVMAILFGSVVPDHVTLYADDEMSGLVDRYKVVVRPQMDLFRQKYRKTLQEARSRFIPITEYEGDKTLVGFWVASDHGDEKFCIDMSYSCLSFSELCASKEYRRARRAYRRFARWAAEQGSALPKGKLFVTPTEVA